MRKTLRLRFWLETGLAIVTSILLVITLVWHDWIEIIFNIDPDQRSGLVEWSMVGALLIVTITLFLLACYELRRTRAAIS